MSNVFNQYPINGVGPYSITFEYQKQEDVVVLYRKISDEKFIVQSNTDWSFENATTIKLNSIPSTEFDEVRIQRSTDVNPLNAIFYPGSAIRAQDLNANFEQLMMAIEEERQSLSDTSDYIDQFFWNKLDDTVTEAEQKDGTANSKLDDDHIFTAGAIAVRHDAYVQEDSPGSTDEQGGKIWNDTDALQDYFWDPDNHVWVSFTKSGPQGEQGEVGPPGLDGQGGFVGDNPPSKPQAGTLWFDTKCPTGLYVYDGVQWIGTSIPGPMGPQGDQGAPGTGGGGPTYTFLPPLQESGDNVSLNLLTLNSI